MSLRKKILSDYRFGNKDRNWTPNTEDIRKINFTANGVLLQSAALAGSGVHTRNGDSIELNFRLLSREKTGKLSFGLGGGGGFEHAVVMLDFKSQRVQLHTSEWNRRQPVSSAKCKLSTGKEHVIRIDKKEGSGKLVKLADIDVFLDEKKILSGKSLNVLEEMGVVIAADNCQILVRRFVQRGVPFDIPEYLHVGTWQSPNSNRIQDNLDSIFRGIQQSAEKGVQLLLTPETSLTGLHPTHSVTKNPSPITEAENKIRRFLRKVKNAPYLIVGLPVWSDMPSHKKRKTRYNVSRVYDGDGNIVSSHPKIHSCETGFWHGYRLNEFDVYGVPVSMHICHDGRYPEVWTLPVMFGARLVMHAVCAGKDRKTSVDAFEGTMKQINIHTHAFYAKANAYGGNCIVGPTGELISVSSSCRRENESFPMCGEPQENLVEAKIRIHDAFGYWPRRSFRASEETAAAYLQLYRTMGGRRFNCDDLK